jgi:preprotein translocase subunit SecA
LYSLFKHDEDYITGSKDILIIHDGVVDCAPRPIPQFFRKLIARLPRQVREKVIRYIHKNRAKILKAGFRYYFTSRKKFKKILTGWLSEASNKFSRIYVINIAPTIPAIEKHSPGFSASIKEYNDIIKEIIDQLKFENTFLVDVHSILLNSEFDMEELILKEDGHHITPLAHSLFANELIRLEAAYTTIHA